MEKKAMFGEIGTFSDSEVFGSHRYGNLYFDAKDHGVEFFSFVHTDAYDSTVFRPNVAGEEERRAYLEGLLVKAMHSRDIGVTIEDNIILLSTCSSESTNGRDILIGRISSEVYGDTFTTPETNDGKNQLSADKQGGFFERIPIWLILLIILILIILYRRIQNNRE
jgi:sortase B